MGTTIILSTAKTVTVKELNASFTLNSCGRESYFQDGKHAGERAYCDISVLFKGQKISLNSDSDPLFLDSFQVNITAMNPWGVEEKGIPAGGCKLDIVVSPAIALITKYNWTAATIENQIPLDIPENLNGLPWYHYNLATTQLGFPLDSLLGQRVALQKIKLAEKGRTSGQNLFAHIVIIDGKAITGWLSAPVAAPGIAPLNMTKSSLDNW